jgi:hypothetical protein
MGVPVPTAVKMVATALEIAARGGSALRPPSRTAGFFHIKTASAAPLTSPARALRTTVEPAKP